MCRGGRNGEAVPKRNRRSALQARNLDHPGCPWKVQRERGPYVAQRLVSRGATLIARHTVVDLDQVNPAHHWAICEQLPNPGKRRLLAVQPGEDRPGVQAGAHRGSRARSSSRRAAIPVFANRPPSPTGDRRA